MLWNTTSSFLLGLISRGIWLFVFWEGIHWELWPYQDNINETHKISGWKSPSFILYTWVIYLIYPKQPRFLETTHGYPKTAQAIPPSIQATMKPPRPVPIPGLQTSKTASVFRVSGLVGSFPPVFPANVAKFLGLFFGSKNPPQKRNCSANSCF